MDGTVNVLVTGGTGFFGHNLVSALLKDARVANVHVLARNAPPTENTLSRWAVDGRCMIGHPPEPSKPEERIPQSNGANAVFASDRVRFFRGDINDADVLAEAMDECAVVFHACGDTRWWNAVNDEQRRTNVKGTATALRAANSASHVKCFVYTSTVDVMGHYDKDYYANINDDTVVAIDGALDETLPCPEHFERSSAIYESHTPQYYSYQGFGYNYADTKRDAEHYVLSAAHRSDLRVVVIRPGSMIGPWDVSDQYGRLFEELKARSLAGIPSGGTSVCHVTDVARAHIVAAFAPQLKHQVYICAGANVSYHELFLAMRAMLVEFRDSDHNVATPIGGVCGGALQIIPQPLLVLYGWLCEVHSCVWSGSEPEVNPGLARYMSCNAYYSSARAEGELGYPAQRPRRWLEAIVESYYWYTFRGRF